MTPRIAREEINEEKVKAATKWREKYEADRRARGVPRSGVKVPVNWKTYIDDRNAKAKAKTFPMPERPVLSPVEEVLDLSQWVEPKPEEVQESDELPNIELEHPEEPERPLNRSRRVRVCEQCAVEFNPSKPSVRFCSMKCNGASRRRPPRECPVCHEQFAPNRGTQTWCSVSCARTGDRRGVCEHCGWNFRQPHGSHLRFCGRQCYRASRVAAAVPCPVCKGPKRAANATCSLECERALRKNRCLNCGEGIRDDNSIGYCTTLGSECRRLYQQEKQRRRRQKLKELSNDN